MITFAALVFSRSQQYQNITAKKVLLHLNREFRECEESAVRNTEEGSIWTVEHWSTFLEKPIFTPHQGMIWE